jgi:hypothetical protein
MARIPTATVTPGCTSNHGSLQAYVGTEQVPRRRESSAVPSPPVARKTSPARPNTKQRCTKSHGILSWGSLTTCMHRCCSTRAWRLQLFGGVERYIHLAIDPRCTKDTVEEGLCQGVDCHVLSMAAGELGWRNSFEFS